MILANIRAPVSTRWVNKMPAYDYKVILENNVFAVWTIA